MNKEKPDLHQSSSYSDRMDVKDAKMTRARRTDKHVQFCSKRLAGHRCKVCDKTFENEVKLHTTSKHPAAG